MPQMPEERPDPGDLAFAAARRAACALVALPAPSVRALEPQRAEGHLGTSYGMAHVSCAPPGARSSLPSPLRRAVRGAPGGRHLPRGQALAPLGCCEAGSRLALDGTGAVASQPMPWASCLPKGHRHSSVPSPPPMGGAARCPPAMREGMPGMPAPLGQHAGTDPTDGDRQAAHRCLAQWRRDHPPRPGGAARAGLQEVPRQAAPPDGRGHGLADWERNDAQGHPGRWGTDCRVNPRNVVHLRRGGCASGQMAHVTCTTLPNPNEHWADHAGHGEQPRAGGCARRRRLACGVDQAQQGGGAWCQAGGRSGAASACWGSGGGPGVMPRPGRPGARWTEPSGMAASRAAPRR